MKNLNNFINEKLKITKNIKVIDSDIQESCQLMYNCVNKWLKEYSNKKSRKKLLIRFFEEIMEDEKKEEGTVYDTLILNFLDSDEITEEQYNIFMKNNIKDIGRKFCNKLINSILFNKNNNIPSFNKIYNNIN